MPSTAQPKSGQYIPPKLYRAVAAILAAIHRAEKSAQAEMQVNRG
jgi:flagellar biosynthesis protein FlhB